mgnify:FL=1
MRNQPPHPLPPSSNSSAPSCLSRPFRVAFTVADLPRSRPLRLRRLPTGVLLVIIKQGLEYRHLERLYRTLRARDRHIIYQALGVPDPLQDPAGYMRARWWHPTDVATLTPALHLEDLGRTSPWSHAGLLCDQT